MTYTKEEVSEIKANLKQIEEYAKENYAPRLRKDESVSVEFGEPDPRRLRYSMDKDAGLCRTPKDSGEAGKWQCV